MMLQWHIGKNSPKGCISSRGTRRDAGGREGKKSPNSPHRDCSDQILHPASAADASPYLGVNLKLDSTTLAIYHKGT